MRSTTKYHKAAKWATYALWRGSDAAGTGAFTIDQLERAEPFIAAADEALSAANETELQATIRAFLDGLITDSIDPVDREIVSEMIAAVVDGVKLKDPSALEGKDVETARNILGGILDGIAYAKWAAAELAARDAEAVKIE